MSGGGAGGDAGTARQEGFQARDHCSRHCFNNHKLDAAKLSQYEIENGS